MSATVTREAAAYTISGDDLLHILGRYFTAADAESVEMGNEEGVGDFVCNNLRADLMEIAKREVEDVPIAAMWIVDCVVRASAATMNEPPAKAIQQIAELLADLKHQLRRMIAREAA